MPAGGDVLRAFMKLRVLDHRKGTFIIAFDERRDVFLEQTELSIHVPQPARFTRGLGNGHIFGFGRRESGGYLFPRAPSYCSIASNINIACSRTFFCIRIGSVRKSVEEVGLLGERLVLNSIIPSAGQISQYSLERC